MQFLLVSHQGISVSILVRAFFALVRFLISVDGCVMLFQIVRRTESFSTLITSESLLDLVGSRGRIIGHSLLADLR